MVRIYTKKGDFGKTRTYCNMAVSKSSKMCVALGNLDELQVWIGIVIADYTGIDQEIVDTLQTIQRWIIKLSSDIATSVGSKYYESVKFGSEPIYILEDLIDAMDAELPPLTKFILIGTSRQNANIHMCRVLARRSE